MPRVQVNSEGDSIDGIKALWELGGARHHRNT